MKPSVALAALIFFLINHSTGADRGPACSSSFLNGSYVPFYCISGQFCCDDGMGMKQCCNPAVNQSLMIGRIVAASLILSLVLIVGFAVSFWLRNKYIWRGDPILNSRTCCCCIKKPTRFYARTVPTLHRDLFPDKPNFTDVEDPFFGDKMKDQLVPRLATVDITSEHQYGIAAQY